jgi:hypothetical protein
VLEACKPKLKGMVMWMFIQPIMELLTLFVCEMFYMCLEITIIYSHLGDGLPKVAISLVTTLLLSLKVAKPSPIGC